ncbi:hypothetical protein OIDMADRAFT_114190, partial [Oidiodendron maius Zn]
YHDAAVHLQKRWDIQDPQQLPFAPHVTNHALVTVVNKGLLYNACERETARARGVEEPVSGFFGPLTLPEPRPGLDEDDLENGRKRQIEFEQLQIQTNGPTKRQRLSNGYVAHGNGLDSTPRSPMDVEDDLQHAEGNAYPSPEQVPSPVAATQGPEQGTQIDKGQPRASVYHNLLDESVPQSTTVTGLTWTLDGRHIAIASEILDDGTAKIEVWNTDGMSLASFVAFESPIVCLRWNPTGTLLLALSPEADGCLITVMSPSTQDSVQTTLPRHSLVEQSLDAAWTSIDEFVLCGGDLLQAFHCTAAGISPVRKYETREGHALSKVAFDWPSRLLATASDTGMIDIWGQQGQCNSFNAHQGLITSLVWQPMQNPQVLGDDAERLLVSAGEDGAISIWNARSTETKSTASMTMGSGVVALAFTPDGAFIAGATSERILIWKFDDVGVPRASWVRGPKMGWQTPQSNDSAPEEDQHCLCWDAEGHKLAYGVNSQVCILSASTLHKLTSA